MHGKIVVANSMRLMGFPLRCPLHSQELQNKGKPRSQLNPEGVRDLVENVWEKIGFVKAVICRAVRLRVSNFRQHFA